MKNNKSNHIILFVACLSATLFFCNKTSAQTLETVVVGQVLNKADNSPLHQVNIYFKNSDQIVQSNEEGYFLIRTNEPYTTLLFTCIGFKQEEIKLKPGQSIGIQVKMQEENTLLQEVFVIPGANPALELMKKVRLMAKQNDLSQQPGFNAQSTEQNLVLLSKVNQRALSKRVFDQLKKGNVSNVDSSLVLPLYMAESKYQLTPGNKKELSKNIFSSPENGEKILEQLAGEMATDLNFYRNSVIVFGKSMASPLANVGNVYYNYYLADSVHSATGKQYEVHFRSKNVKNLAFNGKFWIDSTTWALTKIEVELPAKSNINFIHNLRISENFQQQPNKYWLRQSEELTLNMNYTVMADSLHPNPEIFIKRSSAFSYTDSIIQPTGDFAHSKYTQETLDSKLNDLNNTPLLRTAKWIADVIFTGYFPVGKIDIGKVQQLARLSNIEGLRLTLPFRTNERLWKNIAVGGFVGYGTLNKEVKYSGLAQFKLPGDKKRTIGLNYTNDYRRIDYNYNDFMYHESPLSSGDEDIASTLFSLWSADKLNNRKEFSFSFTNDWNSDIESSLYLRSNKLIANNVLPMNLNGVNMGSFQANSASFTTRFSFGEKTYEDHLQRIYISNHKPVIYLTMEGGQYSVGNKTGNYGKVMGAFKHFIHLDVGELDYTVETGWIFGKVPYPMLETPIGTLTDGNGAYQLKFPTGTGLGGYSMYGYNMMRYMEYGADKYINLHSELTLNGLLMNQIPLIKQLNLRELFSFKMAYGSLSNSHQTIMDYPGFMKPLTKPYMELGVGITNIMHFLSLQTVWRLTDANKSGVTEWGIRLGISIGF